MVQNSLEHLLEFNGFCAAKVNDFKLRGELIDNKKFPVDFTKKYNLNSSAFSTGVFIFDTDSITNNTFAEIKELYVKFNDICQYGEESILNLYFYKQWHKLPIIYNAVPWYMDAIYGVKSNKFTTTIIHFLCYAIKPWHEASSYYQEWLDNFKRADKIDLTNRVPAEASLSAKYLKSYLRFLKFKKIICWLKIDRVLGNLGLLINKISPKLYRLINLKNHDFGK
jgi:lipopolysaccharide biosynthesis glycosyltransferase